MTGATTEPIPAYACLHERWSTTQRGRLLEAMLSLAAARGYEATTVADVAAEAGADEAAFAAHFASKADCFTQALDDVAERVFDTTVAAYSAPGPWPDRIRAALETLLWMLTVTPDWTRLVMVDAAGACPEAAFHFRTTLNAFAPFFDDGLTELQAATSGRPIPADAVVAGIGEVLRRAVQRGEVETLPELLPDLLYVAVVRYVGPRRALAAARAAS